MKKKKEWTLHQALDRPLRLIWMRSPMRREALRLNRLGTFRYNREDGKVQYCDIQRCEICNRITPRAEVDHIEPVGSLKEDLCGAIKRLFCHHSLYKILCR